MRNLNFGAKVRAMNDTPSLKQLTSRLIEFRNARGWQDVHTAKNLAMSVGIESAELLEVFQWTADSADTTEAQRDLAADEAADILIYLLLLCDRLGVDLAAAAFSKIERNELRFPIERAFAANSGKSSKP